MQKCLTLVGLMLISLPGCDQINNAINKPALEAKATGAACRLSARSLEDCYKRNPGAGRAEVYGGWREMNDYMAAKRIPAIAPPPDEVVPPESAVSTKPADEKSVDEKKPDEKKVDTPVANKNADKPE